MGKKASKVITGTLILSITGMLCKVIGVIFRIPLSNILGTEGMGIYQLSHTVFHICITICTGGIPTAVARLVAQRAAKNDYLGVYYYFVVAKNCMILFGAFCAMILYVLATPIAKSMGLREAAITLKAIAPAVFFVAVAAAYRGFYEGIQNMWPSAISQMVEQIVKTFACVFLAQTFIAKGEVYGAMGAMLGVSIAEGVGMLIKIAFPDGRRIKKAVRHQKMLPFKQGIKEVFVTAFPMTLGSSVIPAISSIDSAVAMNMLTGSGYTTTQAASLFGLYSGYVTPLIGLPAVFAGAISTSLVPAIAGARANDRKGYLRKQVNFGVKMSTFMGMPFAVIFYVLAEPILSILYRGLSSDELILATNLLRYLSPAVLFLVVAQIMGGILQGLGRISIPVLSLVFGAIIKLAVGNELMQIESIHIYGAAIGSVLCYGIAALTNGMAVIKYGQVRFSAKEYILKPLVASLAMGAGMHLFYQNIPKLALLVRVVCTGMVGICIYTVMLLIFGAIQIKNICRFLKKPAKSYS